MTAWGIAFGPKGREAWLMGSNPRPLGLLTDKELQATGWRPLRWTRHHFNALPFIRAIDAHDYARRYLPHHLWTIRAIRPGLSAYPSGAGGGGREGAGGGEVEPN